MIVTKLLHIIVLFLSLSPTFYLLSLEKKDGAVVERFIPELCSQVLAPPLISYM